MASGHLGLQWSYAGTREDCCFDVLNMTNPHSPLWKHLHLHAAAKKTKCRINFENIIFETIFVIYSSY